MKTTVINLEGIESVLSPRGIEKHLCQHTGIHKVESNFMTSTATVDHDESVTLEEIKRFVIACGYRCTGECLPEHVCEPGDPPVTTAHEAHSMASMGAGSQITTSVHTGHNMPAARPAPTAKPASAAKADAHAEHVMPASKPAAPDHAGHTMPTAPPVTPADAHTEHEMTGDMASMAHEMGHGGSMNMDEMVRDMRNRFLVAFILAIPVFLYSPLFTDYFGIQLPLPFGLSNAVVSFLLATPAVIYGGWVFYIGA